MPSLARTSSQHYAVATTDTAFKHMLSVTEGNDKYIVISFLNSFIPAFRGDSIPAFRGDSIPAFRGDSIPAFRGDSIPAFRGDSIPAFRRDFIPAFRGDSITHVEETPAAIPALKCPEEKQTFMDLHVISSSNVHYIIEMQA